MIAENPRPGKAPGNKKGIDGLYTIFISAVQQSA